MNNFAMLFYWSQLYLAGCQNKEEKLPEKLHNTKLGLKLSSGSLGRKGLGVVRF